MLKNSIVTKFCHLPLRGFGNYASPCTYWIDEYDFVLDCLVLSVSSVVIAFQHQFSLL